MRLFGLKLSSDRTALPCTLGLWLVLSVAAGLILRLPVVESLLVGLTATALHWFSGLWHDAGHVIAARLTGHPMIGLRLWTLFAINVYPPTEGELPAKIHVQRALGGPIASAILTMIFAGLLAISTQVTVPWWLMLFGFLENLFVMTLQAFLPLGFNDGVTLWKWVPRLKA